MIYCKMMIIRCIDGGAVAFSVRTSFLLVLLHDFTYLEGVT